ncbi:TolC family protein [Ferriphaselus sp. R-1]|uniref:TolC family protein n=1 Tax=Ferriphaselus sp. R-1 TaxID=1485544 RepID=UPI00055666C6|nr:TolC family protein [Ferriphaselus sp. R-1]
MSPRLLFAALTLCHSAMALAWDFADPLSTGTTRRAEASACDSARIQRPLALQDVVDLALCHNPQTHGLWANSRAQAAQLGVNLSNYLPTLSASANATRNQSQSGIAPTTTNHGQSVGLTASYLLLDFGGRAANLENAQQLLIAANATRDASLQSLWLSTAQAYFSLRSARASVAATRTAEAAAQESLTAAQARYLSGSATPADRMQAQTALSQATLNRITAEGNAATAAGTLANLMGFDADQPLNLAEDADLSPDPQVEQAIGQLIAEARRQRPDLVAAEAQIKAAEAQVEAARASGRPSVNLNATTSRNANSGTPDTRGNSIGVSLNIPLFTGMRTTYQTRAAEAQVESRIADRDRLANQIALDVWKAYQSLLTGSQALRMADDLVASAEQSERMTLGRYKAGLGNLLDVLTAQSTLASARQQRITARYNFLASRFALAQAIGELDLTQTTLIH